MTRFLLLTTLLLTSTAALADQAYIQASPWVVNRLPVMAGQDLHQRCVVQTSFTGASSVQFITEGNKLRGAIFLLTEPAFKENGKSIDITLTAGSKSFEFQAQILSKYALAVEISPSYEESFREKLAGTELLRLKSGFNTYNFSVQLPKNPLNEALACALPQPVLPALAQSLQTAATPIISTEKLAPSAVPMPPEMAKVTKDLVAASPPQQEPIQQPKTAEKVVIGQNIAKSTPPKAHIVTSSGKNDVLSDALPKILPEGYNFKFAQGASAGERVSWDKGGDWLDTLIVALDDISLQAAVSGKTVTILPKLQPVIMEVARTETPARADVIVKESDIILPTDPTKPPSPGMKDEASALLAKMRLDNGTLSALLNQTKTPAQQTVDEIIPLAKKDNKVDEKYNDVALSDMVKEQVNEADFTVYKARKGESLQKVIARWSSIAGSPTDLELNRDYFLSKDVNIQGDYDLAVEQVLGQFQDIPDAPRVSGPNNAGQDMHAKAAAPVVPVKTAEPSLVEQRLGIVSKWSAMKGTSLRAALSNWARQGQMQLVWNGNQDLTVAQGITGTARLEEALEAILSQYDNAQEKPNIQINRDPNTGMIAMIVDVQLVQQVPDQKPTKTKK